jgi:hypothetical protein
MPNSVCESFRDIDPGAYTHCQDWLPEHVQAEELDIGISYTTRDKPKEPKVTRTVSDGVVSPTEYYQWAIDAINQDPLDVSGMAKALYQDTGIRLPYLFTDYARETTTDEQMIQEIQSLAQAHEEQGTVALESTQHMLDGIVEHVENTWRIFPMSDALTLGAVETVLAQRGPCQGIAHVYYGAALVAGLKPKALSVEYLANGQGVHHTRAAVPVTFASGIKTDYSLDGALGIFGSSPEGEITVELSALDFVALSYANMWREARRMGLPVMETDKHNIETALKLAPYHYSILEAGIGYYEFLGDIDKAQPLFDRAIEVFPGARRVLSQTHPQTAQAYELERISVVASSD